eukprot:jgi/Picsp_1/3523/NSC_06361-R1_---NA---
MHGLKAAWSEVYSKLAQCCVSYSRRRPFISPKHLPVSGPLVLKWVQFVSLEIPFLWDSKYQDKCSAQAWDEADAEEETKLQHISLIVSL